MRRSPTEIIADHASFTPVNLEGLIADLGLKLQFDGTLPKSIAGKLSRDASAPSGFRVVVNTTDRPQRQRFTMAHEIAHYVLHRDLIRDDVVDSSLYRSTSLSNDYERQADRFAAQILLPAHAVRAVFAKDKALGSLASRFHVSDAALRIRLKELGLAA